MSRYLKFKSILTKKLSNAQINKILSLKRQVYKFSISSQKNWFNKNMNFNDINNLLIFKNKIIGYTALRLKGCNINKKKKTILIFDTFLVERKLRKKGFGSELMHFNNSVILKKNLGSVLLCNKSMIKFYRRFGWKIINNKKIKFLNYKIKKKFIMTKNLKKINNLYINL